MLETDGFEPDLDRMRQMSHCIRQHYLGIFRCLEERIHQFKRTHQGQWTNTSDMTQTGTL